MKLELNKEEAALVEQLVETYINMLDDDSRWEHSDDDSRWEHPERLNLAVLEEARALHYKLLKFFHP